MRTHAATRIPARQILWLFLAIFAWLCAPWQTGEAQEMPESFPCGDNPTTRAIISLTDQRAWSGWIERLSGEQAVTIGGEPVYILTRYSYAMFSGKPHARAFEYVLEQVSAWYPPEQIEVDPFTFDGHTWNNLIVTLPGDTRSDEIVILSAHLDSTSEDPGAFAPGASDNASGSAALLEAARVLRYFRFERTIRLIFFTGEEQGLVGSRAYVQDHDVDSVVGVINLDMFGFDNDRDGCFELHVGTKPASAPVGACIAEAVETYQPNLRFDYLNAINMELSDHATFWKMGIGAVEIAENIMYNGSENGCKGLRDTNPDYHTTNDTIDNLNLPVGAGIAQVALAASAGMAIPLEACFAAAPQLMREPASRQVTLQWQPLDGAQSYQVFRSVEGCTRGWQPVATVQADVWSDQSVSAGRLYSYRVEAMRDNGACYSLPSPCVQASIAYTPGRRWHEWE